MPRKPSAVELTLRTPGEGACAQGHHQRCLKPYREQMRANHGELFSEDGRMQLVPYRVTREDLALVRCPCLLISGSDSLHLLRRIVRIAADAIPSSQFVELAGAGGPTSLDARPVY